PEQHVHVVVAVVDEVVDRGVAAAPGRLAGELRTVDITGLGVAVHAAGGDRTTRAGTEAGRAIARGKAELQAQAELLLLEEADLGLKHRTELEHFERLV